MQHVQGPQDWEEVPLQLHASDHQLVAKHLPCFLTSREL